MKEKIVGIKEQKEIQIQILKYLNDICEKNNINLYLGGGTLLGAVRHKGYIPWDDDIDVMLMRKDYERLLELFNDQVEDKDFKLLSYKNTKDYYYPFAKVVYLKTKMEETLTKEIKDLGIYVDVFPIDYLPDDEKQLNKVYNKYKFYNKIFGIHFIRKCQKEKNIFKYWIRILVKIIVDNTYIWKWAIKKINNLALKYENTDKVACISGAYFEKEIMPSNYIKGYTLVEFEGKEYKAPIDYNLYLTKHYGDYMKLPPKEKQISNHLNKVFWT